MTTRVEHVDPERSAAGRALAALRRRVQRVCALPGCGAPIEGTVRRQYCCNRHAALAGYYRRRAARRTPPTSAAE